MANKGFTLVELLVVVAIIAILAAMVAPVVLQTKEVARMRWCADNMRQLGTAIARYMDDYDGYGLPPPPPEYNKNAWVLCPEPLCPAYTTQHIKPFKWKRPPNFPPNAQEPPVYSVSPYTRPNWLWVCPGDLCRGTVLEDRPCWWLYGSSYKYPGPTAYLRTRIKSEESKLLYPAGMYAVQPMAWKNCRRDILLADFYCDYHNGERAERWAEPSPQSLNPPLYIKVKTVNVLFLDQHLSAVTPEQLLRHQNYTKFDDNPFYTGKP